jgi:alkylated DNA repair dioxygenase AlkB
VKLIDLDGQCWICFGTSKFTRSYDETVILKGIETNLTQKNLEFYGKKFKMPRLTAWFGDREYNYSGTINSPNEMPVSVSNIARFVEKRFSHLPGMKPSGITFNSVLCNYYRDGNDSVEWHSDNERGLGPTNNNVLIASVSFGPQESSS